MRPARNASLAEIFFQELFEPAMTRHLVFLAAFFMQPHPSAPALEGDLLG
jgi:hypothetical protein